jgi:hypothetical protein
MGLTGQLLIGPKALLYPALGAFICATVALSQLRDYRIHRKGWVLVRAFWFSIGLLLCGWKIGKELTFVHDLRNLKYAQVSNAFLDSRQLPPECVSRIITALNAVEMEDARNGALHGESSKLRLDFASGKSKTFRLRKSNEGVAIFDDAAEAFSPTIGVVLESSGLPRDGK